MYDLEEDESYSYLIEEFLEGDSLYALISEAGHFSKAMTIRYGIQICRLVNILHSARPIPILYLDLQPRNLLVCQDVIKLVDFDHAMFIEDAAELKKRYGTLGCAAPEQYTGDVLDERTDIYAIGAVLCYMLTGAYPVKGRAVRVSYENRELLRIIHTCLKQEKERRYTSVSVLEAELEHLERRAKTKNRWKRGAGRISSLIICVVGADRGVGTTHIAAALTVFLRSCGCSAVLVEKNESGAMHQWASYLGVRPDQSGIVFLHGLPVLPAYGEQIRLKPHGFCVEVLDFGNHWNEAADQEADGCLLVCDAKPWRWEEIWNISSAAEAPVKMAILYNRYTKSLGTRLPGTEWEIPCFLMPELPDPMRLNRMGRRVFERLLSVWTEGV